MNTNTGRSGRVLPSVVPRPQDDDNEEGEAMEEDGEANESADICEEMDQEENQQGQNTSKGQ